jgi:predicted small integral membrane protein
MNTSDNRRWALVGPLTVVLWIVGIILINKNGPADHASGSQILAWYKSDSDSIVLGGWLFMLGCLGFVTFVTGLRPRLAETAGRASQLPALALAGAAMAGVCRMLTAVVDLAGGIDKNNIDPGTAATFHHSVDIFFIGAELAAILPLAAVAAVAWRTRVLPRWWAAFSGLVALVLIVGPIGWLGLIFGVPLWTLGTSLIVLLGSRERMTSAAAAA